MLSVPSDFPQAGSIAYLVGTGEPARIIQRLNDGRAIIALQDRFKTASSTRTVDFADLRGTAEEALRPARRAGRRA